MNALLFTLLGANPVGSTLPDLTLVTLQGETLSLASMKGKILIVDFWATWCPPCRAEMPFFNELYKTYRDSGVMVIGINMDEPSGKVQAFVEKMEITYPIVAGKSGREGRAFGGIVGLPTTYVVDQNGTVRARAVGYHPKEYFEGWIQKLLGENVNRQEGS